MDRRIILKLQYSQSHIKKILQSLGLNLSTSVRHSQICSFAKDVYLWVCRDKTGTKKLFKDVNNVFWNFIIFLVF